MTRRSFAGASLCFLQRMELNGARSNPQLRVELARLSELHSRLLRKAVMKSGVHLESSGESDASHA